MQLEKIRPSGHMAIAIMKNGYQNLLPPPQFYCRPSPHILGTLGRRRYVGGWLRPNTQLGSDAHLMARIGSGEHGWRGWLGVCCARGRLGRWVRCVQFRRHTILAIANAIGNG